MSNDKILSVSIAAYNVKNTLDEVLKPFCASKHKEQLDIMIINDGSTDETEVIAKKYVSKYPDLFRLITKSNGGWGSTLNTGFREAKGKYFKQLDGDDYFSCENIDDFIDYLQTVDADMVYSPFVIFEDTTNAILRVVGSYNCFERNSVYYLDEIRYFMPAMHDIAIKVDVLRENNIFITEKCFYTDIEFVIKSYNSCKTMSYFEKPVYYYRIARDGQSMSVTGVKKHYLEHQKMFFNMLDYYYSHVSEGEKKYNIKNRLLDVCKMQYSFYSLLPFGITYKQDFVKFDQMLAQYPEFYDEYPGKIIAFLREHNYVGYTFMCKFKSYREKKNKWGFYAE